MPFDTGGSNEGSKRKWKESSEPANSHDDPEVSHEGPQPKKVKTGTASLSTVNKLQNVAAEKSSVRLLDVNGFSINTTLLNLNLNNESGSHSQPIPGPSSMLSIPMTILTPKSLPTIPAQSSVPFTILKTLHEKVKSLPKLVPTAKKTGPLARYCCDSVELMKDITADVDVWETWDQKLNVLISHSIPDIYPLIARGKYGLITLVQLLEHLVRDCKVDEGLLHGKPVTKKPAGKSSKGGKGSWVPPDTISPPSLQQDKDKLQVAFIPF
ncbi:hypothetical protein L208DRAFT_1539381 [Tricholoma matsutake]|nr:hypothetical protein L208DRAFT_1539381 [Tricholoma matsutake 945]